MSQNQPGNSTFTGVQDTNYDSKVLLGLYHANILTQSFKVIKGYVNTITSTSGTDAAVYQLGLSSNDIQNGVSTATPIELDETSQIVAIAIYNASTTAPGGTVSVGLSSTAGGSLGVTLLSSISATDVNTGYAAIIGADGYVANNGGPYTYLTVHAANTLENCYVTVFVV